ncbi:hypothetical protein FB567DRAFT_315701 [Paraphoma chrysanthemicola]|uniref:Uncharacterized protein n=1 Tax=Paraphoma chrysanthemicola TaxID=798071 RepID=A0A8K0R8C8_9PLEO|nr:hypothetical protein FB567DRAFT_315701 [Paraphoma chrysanthemicola]
MKITLLLFAAAATVMAQSQSRDTVSATASGVCEPHDDHWHCPAGVPQPTVPPALAASNTLSAPVASGSHSHDDDDEDHDHDHAVSASTCEPHGDHWHCPSGVAQPSTRPAAVSATTTRSAASSATAPAVSQSTGEAARMGAGVLAVLGGLGAWIL